MIRFNDRLLSIGLHLAIVVAMLDQFTKWWILSVAMSPRPVTVIVTPFLNFVLSWNRGITFGILNGDYPWATYVFVIAALAVMLLLLYWLTRASGLLEAMALGLVMGGAAGNVIDRLRHGAVVDFLDFHLFGFHWYAFNLADSAIVCGVGLMLFEQLVLNRKKG